MNEEYIDNVKHLIEQKDADKVKGLLIDLHVVNEAFGDCLRRKHFEQLFTSIFVHFDKHVGSNFVIEQAIDELSLFRIQVIAQFGDVGRMEVDEKTSRKRFFRTSKTSNRQETSSTC